MRRAPRRPYGRAMKRTLLLAAALFAALATSAHADVVTDWNAIGTQAVAGTAGKSPGETYVYLAYMHAAVYDAVEATTGDLHRPYAPPIPAQPGDPPEVAAAAAAHRVLATYFPAQQPALDAAYAASVAAVPDGPAKADAQFVGEEAAAQIVSLRIGDGRDAPGTFAPAPGPGVWQPTPPGFLPALTPWLAHLRPFLLARPSQFRPGPPPAVNSPFSARQVRLTQRLGGASSTERTPEQTQVAQFWSEQSAVIYQRAFRGWVTAHGFDLERSARAFAMLDLVAADSLVACWDAKYTYGSWRPVTAIQQTDPSWMPLITTPNHPEYPSAHGCLSSAVAETLQRLIGPSIDFDVTSAVTGTTRHFATAAQLDREIVGARVWGGIHFENSVLVGEKVGRQVASYDAARFTASPAPPRP
jgi:hypothetical protein